MITGATGIAAAAAHRFVTEGARVFTISIDEAECESLHDALGDTSSHAFAVADLSNEEDATAAFAGAVERFGKLDCLFAVAGGSGRGLGDGPVHSIHLEAWDATLAINLTTTFLSLREALRRMLAKEPPGGSIVVTSSVLAEHPAPALFSTHAYATAKGGQLALVRAAAARYATDNIRVNAIAPAAVDSPMSARAQDDDATSAYIAEKQPLGGIIPPEDVAAAALFLLSEEARHVTGQVIAVDAGWGVTEA